MIIRIFWYFKNIMYYEFVYKSFLKNLFDYINFNWIENSIRKFIFDCLFNLNNNVINWLNKRQIIVILFIYKIKYIDETQIIKKVIWFFFKLTFTI